MRGTSLDMRGRTDSRARVGRIARMAAAVGVGRGERAEGGGDYPLGQDVVRAGLRVGFVGYHGVYEHAEQHLPAGDSERPAPIR
jgi:hypothetical protein